MIIGTPMIGVMALIGTTLIEDGSTLRRVQSNVVMPPKSIVAGIREVWFELFRRRRAT